MVTVILQNACLCVERAGKGKVLLSSEMGEAKTKKDPSIYRPDILHQCLLILLDSPLNKAGKLEVLIETNEGKVIEVNPRTRVPRVFSRFSGLILQLLERGRIYSSPEREVLMKVVQGPVDKYILGSTPCYGLSKGGKSFFKWIKEVKEVNEVKENYVFRINVVSKGEDNFGVVPVLSLSEYSLSAATCCSKVCCAFEEIFGVF